LFSKEQGIKLPIKKAGCEAGFFAFELIFPDCASEKAQKYPI
jgi:hypothetical protein